jgi:putative ABC transport system permease protein
MTAMTWPGLVFKNLLRRPMRTLLTALGVSIGVALIVALLSIAAGVRRTASDLVHVGRSDFGLFQSGVSDLTRSLLPVRLLGKVKANGDVADAAGIFLDVTTVDKHPSFLVFGLAPSEFPYKRLVIVEGRRPAGNELLLGDRGASLLHKHPGDTVVVGGRRFPVAGIYHSGDAFEDNGAVLPLSAVQALTQRPGEVTTIGVVVRTGATPNDVAAKLVGRIPGITSLTEPGQAVKVDTSSRLILTAGWVFSLLALIVGGITVTNTMAMSVLERIREIGILRAVGWPSRRIGALIVSEAVGICLLALGIGLALGVLAAELFTSRSTLASFVSPDLTAGVFAWGLAFALGVGLLGAIYPTWMAVRLTPIEALRRD